MPDERTDHHPNLTDPNRDTKGLFAPGNQVRQPNECQKKLYEYRKLEMSSVSKKDLKAIIKKLVEMAKAGDYKAAKLIVERICGKIPQGTIVSVSPDVPGLPQTKSISIVLDTSGEGSDN